MDPAELLKVNSALTWALSRILRSPEPRRIYTGSFWDQPLKPTYLSELFEKRAPRCSPTCTVPRNNTVAKVNDLVMRARMVKAGAHLRPLKKEMPKLGGKDKKQRELIAGLEEVFFKVMMGAQHPAGRLSRRQQVPPHPRHLGGVPRLLFKKLDDRLLRNSTRSSPTTSAPSAAFEAIGEGGMSESPPPPPRPPAPAPVPASRRRRAPGADRGRRRRATPPPASDPWAVSPRLRPRPRATCGRRRRPAGEGGGGGVDTFGKKAPAPHPRPRPRRRPRRASDPWADAGAGDRAGAGAREERTPWAVSEADRAKYETIFLQMQPDDGKVPGTRWRPCPRSGLPTATLHARRSSTSATPASSMRTGFRRDAPDDADEARRAAAEDAAARVRAAQGPLSEVVLLNTYTAYLYSRSLRCRRRPRAARPCPLPGALHPGPVAPPTSPGSAPRLLPAAELPAPSPSCDARSPSSMAQSRRRRRRRRGFAADHRSSEPTTDTASARARPPWRTRTSRPLRSARACSPAPSRARQRRARRPVVVAARAPPSSVPPAPPAAPPSAPPRSRRRRPPRPRRRPRRPRRPRRSSWRRNCTARPRAPGRRP